LRKTLYTLCDESPPAARKAASILLVSSDMIRSKRGGRSNAGAGDRNARHDHNGTERDANRSDDHKDEDLKEELSEEDEDEDDEEEEDDEDEEEEEVDEDDDESDANEDDDDDEDDEDNEEEDKKRNKTNGHKRLRSRYSECENCGKEFDVTQNGKTACNWHDGMLARNTSAVGL
jgi:cobalamin biosynthesis protein CobT